MPGLIRWKKRVIIATEKKMTESSHWHQFYEVTHLYHFLPVGP